MLVVENVSKHFSTNDARLRALQGVSFQVAAGEFVCLLGPSGSGKSTLLRIIGGLVVADSGVIQLDGVRVTEPHPALGFVFQGANLMPWRTVLDNVLLPVEVQQGRVDEAQRQRAHDLLAVMALQGFAHAHPHQLSGGMRQRVVLARALLQRPRLLLMDEPFGALDALTRERLNLELLRLAETHQMTVLMVTHSIPEAVFLADRVLVMSERPGRIVADVAIDLPRPRQLAVMGSAHFGELTMQVRGWIG